MMPDMKEQPSVTGARIKSSKTADLPQKRKETSLNQIVPGFDLTSVRCATELALVDRIHKDEEFLNRVEALGKDIDQQKVHARLQLLTNGYRVDKAITPKLFRLGRMLRRVLRLVRPLDMFVLPASEMNAFCIPSRKGNRFVMCLNSALVATLSAHELLFVMGHEVAHALFRHGDLPELSFEHPEFSPFEVVRLRALSRAQEVTCDRFGLMACQNLRVASTTLFKVASGLSGHWVSFDEMAYSRHFDELSSMAEVIDLEDAARTHPFTPLRVKALIAFSKSETYSKSFGRNQWTIPGAELERGVETMLSVLSPDLAELEGKKEQEAAARFLFDGALQVIAADGVVDPEEVSWLSNFTEQKHSSKELAEQLSQPGFQEQSLHRLEACAAILRNKLSERSRAGLLYAMCEVAVCAGGIPESEFAVLDHLRELLRIPVEIAQSVLRSAMSSEEEEPETQTDLKTDETETPPVPATDILLKILDDARLTEKSRPSAEEACSQIRTEGGSLTVALRRLVSWAITAAHRNGPLTEAQGKRIVVSTIWACRELQIQAGVFKGAGKSPLYERVRKYGVVVMFTKGEFVTRVQDGTLCTVRSVSRTKGVITITPTDDVSASEKVSPWELVKDPTGDDWPREVVAP